MENKHKKLTQRFLLSDAPSSIQLTTTSNFSNNNQENKMLESSTIITPPLTPPNISIANEQTTTSSATSLPIRRKVSRRKNPYPIRSPEKSSEGITFNISIYEEYQRNPASFYESAQRTTIEDNIPSISSRWPTSDSDSDENHIIYSSISNSNISSQRGKRAKTSQTQRTRRNRALGRVIGANGTNGDSTTIRIPPPLPPQEWRTLREKLESLELDNSVLEGDLPAISWKGPPMQITNLPHYDYLQPTEATLASTLRLTPAQYLTSKSSIISAARRYAKRVMPFRKSDAQRLLRIDVNKSSKLWEFFRDIGWFD
ncbi:12662_t:CDS:1 [Ambispora gerdemannii]|uniref:12662_t:CDS:1 n=1 Tax=Ambispora gerdemannii TaxID=144530 RepID=A0A9N9D913_9GLOM|nr:12662_t:CDS:1 [Ambispora gerdemannii]